MMKTHNKKPPGLSDGIRLCLGFILALLTFPAFAYTSYLTSFNNNYGTQGSRLDTCGLCHVDFNGGGTRTLYGEDYRNNNYNAASIGLLDSDGDGATNNQEAAANALTQPGFSCNDYFNAVNAPVSLIDYVDPSNPGCIGPGFSPIANANGPYSVVTGNSVFLSSAGSSDPDGTIVSYLWDFGSFGTSTLANPQVAFSSTFSAKTTVSLTVVDNDGNRTTTTSTVLILMSPNLPPVANAGLAANGKANSAVRFSGTLSSDPERSRLMFVWDFGDQLTGGGGTTSHIYSRCGTYNVTLTVFDDVGLENSATTSANISGSGVNPPTANAGGGAASQYNGALGSNVQFDGSASFDSDCNIVSYSWDFGDGSSGLGINPTHSYTLAGGYVVTLSVTDSDGLITSASANVTIVDAGPLDGLMLYDTNCGSCHGLGVATTKPGATVARINSGIATVPSMASLNILTVAEIQAIADFLATATPPPPPTGPIDGAVSYDTNCGSCHGLGVATTKPGATVARINTGIATVPSMASLSTMSAAEIQAIADFLATVTPPPPPPPPTGPIDGAVSYDTNCGSCHGLGANSGKAGATVARINSGITNVPSMTSLSSLGTAEIQAISDFLMSLAPPTTPQGLYATYCASCHGADGSGGTSGKNVIGDSAKSINKAIAKEQDMLSLSFLTSSEVQFISDFLNGVTSPPPGNIDGLALYDINCAGCHGLSSNSAKAGATAARINSGIANEPSMFYFSNALSAAEIQAIGDFLVSVAPTPPASGDGAGLYSANCAACHGPGNSSSKAGANVARINTGISSVSSMNYLSTLLTTADVQTIANFLATTPVPTTPKGKYISYCGSCHGVDGQGGSSDKDVTGDSSKDISKAIRKKKEMQSLSFLSNTDIRDIADYLDVLKSIKKQQKGD